MFDPRSFVAQVADLHAKTVTRWHTQPLDNPYTGILAVICEQHQQNFLLSRVDSDQDEALAGLTQQRRHWLARIDETLVQMLAAAGVAPEASAQPTEQTPGGLIDRLSVLAMRVYRLRAEMDLDELDDAGAAGVYQQLRSSTAEHREQLTKLSDGLAELIAGHSFLKLTRGTKVVDSSPRRQAG